MAIIWKNKFSQIILDRGKEYFDNGNVKNISYQSGGTYMALVDGKGREKYFVRIIIENDKVKELFCNCPYGSNCKHEVAVLFEMEKRGLIAGENKKAVVKVSAKKKKELVPFKNFLQDETEYHYFNMEKMTKGFIFYEDVMSEAKKLVENNSVAFNEFSVKNDISFASFIITDSNSVSAVEITFSPEKLVKVYCNSQKYFQAYSNNSYYENGSKIMTAYTAAALLLLGERLKTENPGDLTDDAGEDLMDYFAGKDLFSFEEEEEVSVERKGKEVRLVPVLEYEGHYLKCGFKIGSDKVNNVKNLADLVYAYKNKKEYVSTKKNVVDFSVDFFDEDSQKYFDLFSFVVEDQSAKKELEDKVYLGAGKTYEAVKTKIMVYGKRLDDFFDIAEGRHIEINNVYRYEKDDVREKTFKYGFPNISFQLKKHLEHGVISSVEFYGNVPNFIMGADYIYFLGSENFYRVPKEHENNFRLIARYRDYDGEVSITIGRKRLTEFIYHVLPKLKETFDIETPSFMEVAKILPPQAKLKFYFDSDEEFVSCKAVTVYADKEYATDDFIFNRSREAWRDARTENFVCELLKKYLDVDELNNTLQTDKDDKIFDLLNSGLNKFMELGEVNMSESFGKLKIHRSTKVSVGVKMESGLLDIDVTSDELTQNLLLEILSGMKKKKKYVHLTNGDFVNTQDETLEELESMFSTMHISPKEFIKGKIKLPAYRALYLDKMLEASSGIHSDRDTHFKNLVKEFKTVDDSEFEIPQTLVNTMRSYQVYGHRWLRTLAAYNFGGILADDMGLGKTLQTISVLLAAKQNGMQGTSLVVSPASLIFNWGEEFKKFAPELKVQIISGTAAERYEAINSYEDFDVLVTSYDLLKRDITEYEEKNFLFEIIDEGQFIKNHTTAQAKSVKVIRAEHKFALTGTPIENRLSELWSIFDYLMPGFLFGYEDFKKKFETPIVKNKDENASAQLRRMVSPFILHRLKKDVLKDLPNKIEEVRYARFDEPQQKLYDAQAVKIKRMLDKTDSSDFSKGKIQLLAELTKMRQICCDPNLLFENYKGESAKLNACLDLVRSAIEGGHKILLFSQFTSMLEIIGKNLSDEKIDFYKITGETKKETRLELVQKFNSNDVPVFLISLKAGGTGLNLTGADVVIHYDPWWNVAAQNQATDRSHRIGQTKVVSVYKLIAKDSIEEKILDLQNSKKNLADEILTGEGGNISSMTKDEILSLL